MFGYICLFNGKRFEVHAESQYQAQLMALDHFKPSKSKRHLVSVHLAEKPNGDTVVHTPVD